ncbi:signal peptide peptidase SppA [Thermosulfurimonas marina]|uniref:Signal peptide peptidase SppA n=1 Tax=Thermosulfurimonas marina TaxID=2047767 RepID=A0A6H1WUN7_9BACT|nr:signal peptide peptidase SppA [Thermosulfurimonas marina]QJA06891.1 signal peptide peptidase SppA [Thermosulfurimonas marina]
MRKGVLYALALVGAFFLFLVALAFLLSFWTLKGQGLPGREAVGVVEIRGLITQVRDQIDLLENFRRRKEIRAVVVRIESPGGTVGASQELYEELRQVSQEKPVVVSLGSLATSGAYYVALGGQKILALPGTVTGSIGVLLQVPNLEGLLKKLGIKPLVLKSGAHKDLVSYYREPTPEEKRLLQEVLDDIHTQFIKAVSERRGLPEEKVRRIADGRIFTGRQARALGLIDDFGNLARAVEVAAKMAGLSGPPRVIYGRPEQGLLRRLLEGRVEGRLLGLWAAPWFVWTGGS